MFKVNKLLVPVILVTGLIALITFFSIREKPQSPENFTATSTEITADPLSTPLLQTPRSGETVTGPLVIKGQVPKSWTFEGQFQMQLLDDRRHLILTDRVPVEWDNENNKLTLDFIESYNYQTQAKSGFLVLRNDNPSGLPENEKSFEIPIKFSSSDPGTIYLFQPGTGNSEIDSQCEAVLPQPANIGVTQTPIKDTLNLLARSMHPDFYVKSLNLVNGLLTIEFPVINTFTSGGSCAQRIHYLQVAKTALQFPQVEQIKIVPESIFQP